MSTGNRKLCGMARRSYEQACTLARTLDLIGERWTLLIVRELMLGPQRFTDLLHRLPGIGRNLLAARLRHLEEAGLLERDRLAPPAASRVYRLTEDGRALGPAMAELGRWGAERLPTPPRDFVFRPGWAVFPMSYMADRDAAEGLDETWEFRVDGEAFHLRVRDGRVVPRAGSAERPDLVITLDGATLRGLFFEGLDPMEAVAGGRVAVEGAPESLQHALAVLAPR